MALKKFLSIGNLLINPDLLAYAAFEEDSGNPRLRLGFATASGVPGRAEIRLTGEDAGVAIRWLRLHATHLTREGVFGPIARPIEVAVPRQATNHDAIGREAQLVADRSALAY
jgi:hypothetical protein